MSTFRLLYVFASFCLALVNGDVQCRDENNNSVDWYVLYKFPKFSTNPLLKEGKGYMYITSSSLEKGWQISSNHIDSNSSIFSHTLPFLKDESQKVFWLVYNDQGNDSFCVSCGHTKGVIAGNENGGIWLVHSVPRYLDGTYPRTGLRNGQSALCLTLSKDQLNSIGDLLAYNRPNFQKWNINDDFKKYYPKLMEAFKGVKVSSPWTLEKSITTVDGTQFHAFAKSRQFNKDLYEWVAASLKTDLYAETWINEIHTLPSSCNLKYRVMNIASMMVPKLNETFSSHKDHSKVAISGSGTYPWVCIGDINRAMSQERRGGGTICLTNSNLWKSYRSLIVSTENCSSYNQYEVQYSPTNELKFLPRTEQEII